MPQHKHVTVELLRIPSTSFASEVDACNGRGTTLRRSDPTGTAVAVMEHSLTGKHMLENNSLVPSLPRESDATTAALVEAAAARGGHGKKGQAIRDRAVAFTAYPELDGYVDYTAGSVSTWCLLLANSHSELDMAVNVRVVAAGMAWDHEFVPYDRPVIVRTDSYVVIKLVEAEVLPDPMRIVVEWFHVRSTFALGGSSRSTVVTMQIDPLPYVLFDVALQSSAPRVTDPEVLRVAQQEMRMALDLALEEFELGQLLIPSPMNVYDKITLARNSFRAVQELRAHERAKSQGKKAKASAKQRRKFDLSDASASILPLSLADRSTRQRRLKLAGTRLKAKSRSAFTTILGAPVPTKKQRRPPEPIVLPARPGRRRSGPDLDAALAVAPHLYPLLPPPVPAILVTPEPRRASGFPAAFTRGARMGGNNERGSGSARVSRGQLQATAGAIPREIIELLSDTSNDVDMDDGGGATAGGVDDGDDDIVILE